MISAIYIAVLAIAQIALTANVVRMRLTQKVSLGTEKGDAELLRAVRAHGNFIEIVPMGLLLLLAGELQGAPGWCVHSLGMLLLAGRGLHAYAILKCPHSAGMPRTIGMLLNLAALFFGALVNLWLALAAI